MTIKTGDPNTSHLLFDVESEIKGLGTDPFVLSGIVQKFCTSIYPSGGLWSDTALGASVQPGTFSWWS